MNSKSYQIAVMMKIIIPKVIPEEDSLRVLLG